jgi:hypothetical protein
MPPAAGRPGARPSVKIMYLENPFFYNLNVG